jgi:hypothetical protein
MLLPFVRSCVLSAAAAAVQPAAQFAVHELSFQDLFTSKPQWLLDLNPAGLVPFMAWSNSSSSGSSGSSSSWDTQAAVAAAAAVGPGAVVVRESLVCNEYLEDKFPDPPVSFVICYKPGLIQHTHCAELQGAATSCCEVISKKSDLGIHCCSQMPRLEQQQQWWHDALLLH